MLFLCLADGAYELVVGGGADDSEIDVQVDGTVDGSHAHPGYTTGGANAGDDDANAVSAVGDAASGDDFEIRFVVNGTSDKGDERVPTQEALALAAEYGLVLATRVIGGWPHGHVFSAPINLTVTLASAGEILYVLYKADDDAEWIELPASDIVQPSLSECRIEIASLCYFALLKKATTSSGFNVAGGSVLAPPSAPPTTAPSPACPAGESLYKLRLTDAGGDGWGGATWRVVDQDTGAVVASGTLEDGAAKSEYLCLADGEYRIEVGGGDADSEVGVELDGSVAGEVDADGSDGGDGGDANNGDFTASGGEVVLPPTPAPSFPLAYGGGRTAGGGLGDWWWLLLLLLLLLCCCCFVLFFFCCGRNDDKKNFIVTMEDDAQGAMAHRAMVQTKTKQIAGASAAHGATGDEATINALVINAGKEAPRVPTRTSVAGSVPRGGAELTERERAARGDVAYV